MTSLECPLYPWPFTYPPPLSLPPQSITASSFLSSTAPHLLLSISRLTQLNCRVGDTVKITISNNDTRYTNVTGGNITASIIIVATVVTSITNSCWNSSSIPYSSSLSISSGDTDGCCLLLSDGTCAYEAWSSETQSTSQSTSKSTLQPPPSQSMSLSIPFIPIVISITPYPRPPCLQTLVLYPSVVSKSEQCLSSAPPLSVIHSRLIGCLLKCGDFVPMYRPMNYHYQYKVCCRNHGESSGGSGVGYGMVGLETVVEMETNENRIIQLCDHLSQSKEMTKCIDENDYWTSPSITQSTIYHLFKTLIQSFSVCHLIPYPLSPSVTSAIISGPSGIGKSTTCYAIMKHLESLRQMHYSSSTLPSTSLSTLSPIYLSCSMLQYTIAAGREATPTNYKHNETNRDSIYNLYKNHIHDQGSLQVAYESGSILTVLKTILYKAYEKCWTSSNLNQSLIIIDDADILFSSTSSILYSSDMIALALRKLLESCVLPSSHPQKPGFPTAFVMFIVTDIGSVPPILRSIVPTYSLDVPTDEERLLILKHCCHFLRILIYDDSVGNSNGKDNITINDNEEEKLLVRVSTEICVGMIASDIVLLCSTVVLDMMGATTIISPESSYQHASVIVPLSAFFIAKKTVKPSLLSMASDRPSIPSVHWEDIGGLSSVKDLLQQLVVWPFLYSAVAAVLGVSFPSGLLLHGPPGTGKTLIAKCLATECHANFLSVDIASLIAGGRGWLGGSGIGEAEHRLSTIFQKARNVAPTILFFDEIQAMFPSKGDGSGSGSDSGHKGSGDGHLLTVMTQEMDLCYGCGVMVVGATNHINAIDAALLSPGRFEYVIAIPPPDEPGRCMILTAALSRMVLMGESENKEDVSYEWTALYSWGKEIHIGISPLSTFRSMLISMLGKSTEGLTGSALMNIGRMAVIAAYTEVLQDASTKTLHEDVPSALDSVSLIRVRHFRLAVAVVKQSERGIWVS